MNVQQYDQISFIDVLNDQDILYDRLIEKGHDIDFWIDAGIDSKYLNILIDKNLDQLKHKIKAAIIMLFISFKEEIVIKLLKENLEESILSNIIALELALKRNMFSDDVVFSCTLQVLTRLAVLTNPKDPESTYKDILSYLDVDDTRIINSLSNIHILKPTIH